MLNFILKTIGVIIAFILCAWFFLGISPVDSWGRIVNRTKAVFASGSDVAGNTGNKAAELTSSAASLTDSLAESANRNIERFAK